jgi:dual-specificity kinase
MSTPQTLVQTLPPHQYLDHRQRCLPSPHDRYLPPPRPSSNASFHGSIPTRPPSNVQLNPLPPPPPRPTSGMSNSYTHGSASSQARGGAEYGYVNGLTQQLPHEDLTRTNSAASHYQRVHPQPEPKRESRVPPPPAQASVAQGTILDALDSNMDRKRRRDNRNVDWHEFYGGRPPKEVIVIHDDDSPAPQEPAQARELPPTNGTSTAHHVDKRRRVNGNGGDVPNYSATNTPYSYSNGDSTESLAATTAPTSLGSNASTSSRLDSTQTGQKRKRNTRTAENERKKQDTGRSGPRGYLAEYGEYVPPPKQYKKQKDVVVPVLSDVWFARTREMRTDG